MYTKRNKELSEQTLEFGRSLYLPARRTDARAQGETQRYFLTFFNMAMNDVAGQVINGRLLLANDNDMREWFITAKRLVKNFLKKEDKQHFESSTFSSYFSIVKRLLIYDICEIPDAWQLSKSSNDTIFQKAHERIRDLSFPSRREREEAFKAQVNAVKIELQDADDDEKNHRYAKYLGNLHAANITLKTKRETQLALWDTIHRILSHEEVAQKEALEGSDPIARDLRQVFGLAEKYVKQISDAA